VHAFDLTGSDHVAIERGHDADQRVPHPLGQNLLVWSLQRGVVVGELGSDGSADFLEKHRPEQPEARTSMRGSHRAQAARDGPRKQVAFVGDHRHDGTLVLGDDGKKRSLRLRVDESRLLEVELRREVT
jgi:hypothetical protein